MDSQDLLKDLNAEQLAAVTHVGGPLLIVAGAGTGKTTVITRRIAWLISEGLAKPEEILALTFTDKSAGEMEERVDRLLPYGYVDLWIQTFHAFGERILREHALAIGLSPSFKILSKTEQWLLVRRHWNRFELDYYRPLGNPTKFIDALLTHFSRAEDELVDPAAYLEFVKSRRLDADSVELPDPENETKRLQEVADAFHLYKRLLREEGALDFSDLINETLRLFRERPAILKECRERFKYILVDEFQDTNFAQYELVKMLAGERKNVTVVGDDDQSIYKFRGAAVSNILDFERDFAGSSRVVLTANYRSRQEILDFAYDFIQQNNPDRLEAALAGAISKRLVAANGSGGVVSHLHGRTLQDEARLTVLKLVKLKDADPESSWNDFAILVRANDHADPFLTALKIANVPHEFLASRGLYHKPVVMDILAYLRLLDDRHESASLYRILNSPVAKLELEDLLRLTHHASRKTESLYETLHHAATVEGVSEAGVVECSRIVAQIEKHAELARTRPANVVILAFLNDTGYLKASAAKREDEAREDMRILASFWRTIESFVDEDPEPTVKNFLARIELEIESGDSGQLPLDPESGPEMVRVMTIHASKGLEYKHVFIANLVDKRFPTIERKEPIRLPDELVKEHLPGGDAHLQEERRLFYVACTRAKETLYLTSAEDYGGARKKKPSRFLTESKIELVSAAALEPVMEVGEHAPSASVPLPMPERMSYSQFEAFDKCPLQYKFEHIYRIPKAGNANKSFGQSIHNTLHEAMTRYLARAASSQQTLFGETGAPSPLSFGEAVSPGELQEIFAEKWIDDWYDSKEQMKERLARGRESLMLYHSRLAGTAPKVHMLEQPFLLKLEGVTVKGRIDRIDMLPDGTVEIVDYKTGKAKDDPDRSQLFIYQLAALRVLGLKPSKLTFVYLESGDEFSFLGTEDELAKFEAKLCAIAVEVRKSSFAPTPDKNVCRFCDFKRICEFSSS